MNLVGNYPQTIRLIALLIGYLVGGANTAAAQSINLFPIPTPNSAPYGIAAGADGNLWFTETANNIGRITPAGVITEFPIPTAGSNPSAISAGPDGNLWFAESGVSAIGRITAGGVIAEFPIPTSNSNPSGIAIGADGNLWFTEFNGNKIGRITLAGVITEFPVPTADSGPLGIAAGSDGNVWFTELNANNIGQITPAGVVTEFPLPTAGGNPFGITAGPDGNLWFGELIGKVGRITPTGVITEFSVPTASSSASNIVTGSDGNLWFMESGANKIGRITTSGVISEFSLPTAANSEPLNVTRGPDGNMWFTGYVADVIGMLSTPPSTSPLLAAVAPSSRSVQVGNFATAFAVILNTSGGTAQSCGLAPITPLPANFSFQTTDPATNSLIGAANNRVSIPPGGSQTFLMAFQANGPYPGTDVQVGYDCAGLDATGSIVGVNTLRLIFDVNPVADMIAVGDTVSHDGYARIPGVGGTGIFVTASSNIGVATPLTASARMFDPSMQLQLTICETDMQTGICKSTPSPTVSRTINHNENTTWTAFLTATIPLPADPAHNRVVFEFRDSSGNVRGSTSTAVTTQ